MIADDRPLALKEAAERYGFTVSTLRAEAKRGRLTIYEIGRKHYTLPSDIEAMIRQCRVEPSRPVSISTRNVNAGLSETDRVSSAQERAKESVAKLKKLSPNISV
jgi:hypothetical protein